MIVTTGFPFLRPSPANGETQEKTSENPELDVFWSKTTPQLVLFKRNWSIGSCWKQNTIVQNNRYHLD